MYYYKYMILHLPSQIAHAITPSRLFLAPVKIICIDRLDYVWSNVKLLCVSWWLRGISELSYISGSLSMFAASPSLFRICPLPPYPKLSRAYEDGLCPLFFDITLLNLRSYSVVSNIVFYSYEYSEFSEGLSTRSI